MPNRSGKLLGMLSRLAVSGFSFGTVSVPMSAGFSFPWEQAAMHGDDMPDGLCVYEQAAFRALRWLYRSYHEKAIDRETAGKEKQKIRKALDAEIENAKFQDGLAKHRSEMFKRVEAANSAYRLSSNHTPEADRLSDTILGLERSSTYGGN